MLRIALLILTLSIFAAGAPVDAAPADTNSAATNAAAAAAVPSAKKLGCDAPGDYVATSSAEAQATAGAGSTVATAAGPKVVFKLNKAEDAPTILRFVTNYLAVEPTAKVAVVGYGPGIDFMLEGARDANGRPYAEQMAALAMRGVAFKVCNNTLKARNATPDVVAREATVVPGAVNEILRLQTREGYAYFQN